MSGYDSPSRGSPEPRSTDEAARAPGPRTTVHGAARDAQTEVVPPGGLPCLWMSAGLLAWRLCEREYDCEGCPLDAALRGGARPLPRSDAEAVGRRRLEFPDDRLYSRSHGWVQLQEDGSAHVGLDAFVLRLLDQVSAVVLPSPGSRLQRGQPLCWLVDAGVPIPITCPLAGLVLRVNTSVQADPRLLSASAYDRGWLVALAPEEDVSKRRGIGDAGGQRVLAGRQLRELRRRGARRAGRARRALGATLCDGGQRLRGPRGVLGTPAYHRIVRSLLQ